MHLAPPVPPSSPTSVRFACALLYGVAGLCLLSAVLELVFVNTGLSVYRDAYTGDTGSGFRSLVGATLDIVFAGGAAVLAVLNGQGRRNARVTTYVLGGLSLLCGGLGALSDPFHGPSGSAGPGAVQHLMPAVYGISAGALDALTALATLTALVLLAAPSANHFFELCHRNRYVLIVTTPQPHPGYDATGAGTSHSAGIPAQTELPPHTSSLPAIDPWAGPGAG
ncbi:hypothetical protein COUCH_20495 [Couchioplanes caeruleus]|uniref:hypothetical protein n=1 Tax=Couchioplanes caeruleus TaxID=56438 RepID=UPI0020BE885D|nr:hypothetical protein [Couchioplanes caeruleus]UQU61443.1 hypothetical protein COUCH_20495 [Couchioplanes caeruleus]